jgi:hypothetical protein
MNARLVIAALLISVISKNLWEYTYQNLYYHGDAIAWLLFSIVLYRLSFKEYWLNRAALIALYWSIADLLDWIIFDPYNAGWNEYMFAVIILILVFRKSKRKWLKQQKKRANLL